MNKLTRPYRWFGLDIGGRRYAVDFQSVSTVFYQPNESAAALRAASKDSPFLNIRGLMVHEGAPVFLLSPSRLFTSADGPLDPAEDNALPVASVPPEASAETSVDGSTLSSAPVAPWVVIFRGDSLSGVGIRVDRASGPFRMVPETSESDAFRQGEIQHVDLSWRVVRLRPNVTESLHGEAE
jgi:hypothetical protein